MSWLRHFDNKFRLLIPWGLQKWHGYAVWVGGYAVWGVATPFFRWDRERCIFRCGLFEICGGTRGIRRGRIVFGGGIPGFGHT
jgi:hypothetical protein